MNDKKKVISQYTKNIKNALGEISENIEKAAIKARESRVRFRFLRCLSFAAAKKFKQLSMWA